jgi:NTP pyrophosphatase (non-canonical NTP hydrolase)
MSQFDRLDSVRQQLREFVAERDWEQFHDPKNLAMTIASEAGELVAEYRWVRSEHADGMTLEPEAGCRVAAEAADVGIAWLLFCDRVGIDPLEVVEEKIRQNRDRYPVHLSKGRSERPQT